MHDTSENSRTLSSYQNRTDAYIEGTPPIDAVIKEWLDKSLRLIPRDAKILEVGSGFGRDAEYVCERGFEIECSDAVPNFIELLKNKGFNTRKLDLLRDDIAPGHDMILADAVLLHFTPDETLHVTQKIHAALNSGGVFSLRMKQGNGSVWSDEKLNAPRYFYYWSVEDLKAMLTSCGFEWVDMADNFTEHNKASWLHIIARKQ